MILGMREKILFGIAIFAFAGLMISMTVQTLYAKDGIGDCHEGVRTDASGNPELLKHDKNGNGFVCVDETIKKNGKIKVKITDDDDGGATGCPPNCGR